MDDETKKELAKSELRQISHIEGLLELAKYQEKANTWTLLMIVLILFLIIAHGVETSRLQTQVNELKTLLSSTTRE